MYLARDLRLATFRIEFLMASLILGLFLGQNY